MADGEAHGARGRDQRLLFVDLHPPTRRQAEDAERAEEDCREQHALVDQHGMLVAAGQPQHEAAGSEHHVENAGDAPTAVVGELVRTDELTHVEVVGQRVADLPRRRWRHSCIDGGRFRCGCLARVRLVSHRRSG